MRALQERGAVAEQLRYFADLVGLLVVAVLFTGEKKVGTNNRGLRAAYLLTGGRHLLH
jgi:hypothetical protein